MFDKFLKILKSVFKVSREVEKNEKQISKNYIDVIP